MTNPKTITQVRKFLNSIPNIDCGGCGISLLSMYRYLKKKNRLDNTKFIFLYRSKHRFLNNSRVLRNKKGEAVAPSHCCLSHNGKFIDCKENVDITEYNWTQVIDEEEFIKKSVNNVNDWNSDFDRKNIKLIEETLDIDLSDINIYSNDLI